MIPVYDLPTVSQLPTGARLHFWLWWDGAVEAGIARFRVKFGRAPAFVLVTDGHAYMPYATDAPLPTGLKERSGNKPV